MAFDINCKKGSYLWKNKRRKIRRNSWLTFFRALFLLINEIILKEDREFLLMEWFWFSSLTQR